jgi:hypothetical protein
VDSYDRPVPFDVAVSEPSKQGSGMNSFVSYKVSCKVMRVFTSFRLASRHACIPHASKLLQNTFTKISPAPFITLISDINADLEKKKHDEALRSVLMCVCMLLASDLSSFGGQTALPQYQNPTSTVTRRYNHFMWLHSQLTEQYPCHFIPACECGVCMWVCVCVGVYVCV